MLVGDDEMDFWTHSSQQLVSTASVLAEIEAPRRR